MARVLNPLLLTKYILFRCKLKKGYQKILQSKITNIIIIITRQLYSSLIDIYELERDDNNNNRRNQ